MSGAAIAECTICCGWNCTAENPHRHGIAWPIVVTVWNDGAPRPCWTARCRTLEEAEGLAARYRETIARNGWNKIVQVAS